MAAMADNAIVDTAIVVALAPALKPAGEGATGSGLAGVGGLAGVVVQSSPPVAADVPAAQAPQTVSAVNVAAVVVPRIAAQVVPTAS